jgi:periplasmic protein TonB
LLKEKNKTMKLFKTFLLLQFLELACIKSRINQNEKCPSFFNNLSKKHIYTYVDTMPEYVGGNIAFINFIGKNLTFQNQNNFQASFQIEFIIESQGKLTMAKINNKNEGKQTAIEKAIIDIIKNSPNWKPGRCNGKNVTVKMMFPLKLSL